MPLTSLPSLVAWFTCLLPKPVSYLCCFEAPEADRIRGWLIKQPMDIVYIRPTLHYKYKHETSLAEQHIS